MPAVQAPAKVLVSGANGYIAAWVVQELLDQGYSVRGTVRSAEKGEHLKKLFAKFGDKHEVVVVEDITKEGAFDEAVKGVDAIEHTASPFHFKADDPDELIVPAVKGTVSMLQSALKYGTSVKRVVITSSTAAVVHVSSEPKIFSEKDWNDQAIQTVKEQGRNAIAAAKYRASKTLAEKAAWEFFEKNKASISWDLVALNPPFVFGPVIHSVPNLSALNTSVADWYNTVLKKNRDAMFLAKTGSAWVDVRDLAKAHRLAIQKSEAGGERIIVSKGRFVWQEWVDAAKKVDPKVLSTLANPLPEDDNSLPTKPEKLYLIDYDTSKAKRILGIDYKDEYQCARDMIADFGARGW